MAHTFEHTLDEWAKNGTKSAPSSTLKSTGFVGGMKPPASVFNYQWDKIAKAITELQQYALTEDPSGGIWQQLAAVATSGNYNDLLNKPEFKAVATSGSYNDLLNKPDFKAIATSGSYSDLINVPIATGSYVGDGTGTFNLKITATTSTASATYIGKTPREIEFPFAPQVLLLIRKNLQEIKIVTSDTSEKARVYGNVKGSGLYVAASCDPSDSVIALSGNKLQLISTSTMTQSSGNVTSYKHTALVNPSKESESVPIYNDVGYTYYYLAF